ncbi:MAG: MerR family transcriptional regulator [Chloroflexota bacterium]|nr:MerR family transcriptional regulator [Chloroflexota bacterium]
MGVAQRQLAYWDQSGLVRPHVEAAKGPGSRRLYSLTDVLRFKLVRRLRDTGLSVQKIRQALTYLDALLDEPAPLSELEVYTDGRRILVRRSDERLLDPLAQQFVLLLRLSDLLAEVQTEISAEVPEEDEEVPRPIAVQVGSV